MKLKQKLIFGLFLIVGMLFLVLGARELHLFEASNVALSNSLYHPREISDEILIVGIDNKTLSKPEEGGLDSSNKLGRDVFSQVIKNIEIGQPEQVMIDRLFSSPSSDAEDFEFAETLAAYSNVYLVKSTTGNGEWDGEKFVYSSQLEALESFAAVAKQGFANVKYASDSNNYQMVYSIPTFFSVDGSSEKHIDLMLAEDYLGSLPSFPMEQGQLLINYAQEPFRYPAVSFSDVYYGRVDSSLFEGKIVLIGPTASVLQDLHYTPIDSTTPMPGIEIHANAIQTLLDGKFLTYQSTGGFAVMVGLMLLVGVLAFLYLPVLWGSGVFVIELALFPLLARWSFDRGVILDLIWPVVALVATYLAVLAYRNFTEFAEKRKLREAFSHYVAPEVVAQITEKPELLALGGERRNITAFFLDIENFTHLSEGLSPQEVVKVINLYFDALSKVIMANGGSVDKFEGDAIMALFGAPVPSQDHAEKACRAALAVREKMDELNAASGYQLNVRIGLATGDAIVGNMGSEERFDYTAMGDTVNTASRLEGANKFYRTRILVTEGTMQAAQADIFFRHVDTVCLKGKDQALRVYEVLGTMEGASESGKKVMQEWHTALEAYARAKWDEAERGMKAVLERLPHDGPAETLLARIALLRVSAPKDWDGVWRFESK